MTSKEKAYELSLDPLLYRPLTMVYKLKVCLLSLHVQKHRVGYCCHLNPIPLNTAALSALGLMPKSPYWDEQV